MGWELRVWTEWHGLHWPVGSESLWERKSALGWAFLGISGKWSKEIQPALFVCSRAAPTAYRGSKARGLIGAVAAGLHHIHSNVGSALSLQPTTTAHGNVISLTHWARPGIKPATSWFLVGFTNHWDMMGTPQPAFWLRLMQHLGVAEPERGGKPDSWHQQDGTRVPSGPRCCCKPAGAGSELVWMVRWA